MTFFKYLLPPLLPFILALITASFIRPAAIWCRNHFGLGAKPVSVIIILGILFLFGFLIWNAGCRLAEELSKFLVTVTENSSSPNSPIYRLTELLEGFKEKFPIPEGDSSVDFYELTTELIHSGTAKLSSALASAAGTFIKKLPSAIIAFGVSLIAVFYLTLDYEGAASAVRAFLPSSEFGNKIISGYRRVTEALWKYLRSYFLIMLVTFAELYLGFTIIRVEYSLLFAVVIAIVDFLPLLGVGTVLIPWGTAALLIGEHRLGIGILIIYAVVCIVRQLLEPRIVGNFIGTHPLIALAGVYTGLKLFGFIGMVAAPVILYLVKALRNDEK